jgi:assimilatory nitrate reductase catalytic subunit
MKFKLPLRAWDGPLTDELVRHPAKFGLGQVPQNRLPDSIIKSICGFCSTGCGLTIHLKEGQAVNLTPDALYPVNSGTACPKGWEALTPLISTDRATTPLLQGQPVDWHTALTSFCEQFKKIQAQHGNDSIAFLSTGQIMMEEMALLGSVAKFGMGMIHGDGNTRQCMATAVTAYKESFGFDAPPFTYEDFELSDVIVFIGANPCIAHPIMWQRVLKNKRNPEIIVIDPRLTETAMAATQHYPLQPKSDLILLYGIAHQIIKHNAIDSSYITNHTDNFTAFAEFLKDYDLPTVAAATHLSESQILKLVQTIIHGTPRVSFWWTMGVNQSHEATRTAQAIINLALMTGNIGKPGTGANSITGQCNAMGSRLFSNTTNLLGGHDFRNPAHRQKVAAALDIPIDSIPTVPSLPYDQIIESIEQGKIKGLWIIATNPAHSWINQKRFKALREKLDFLVVQDMYFNTETAQMADLVLPAAGWGEKAGCFINSERRIGVSYKVSKPPGLALADFNIFRLVAQYWGCGHLFKDWQTPEHAFQFLKKVSKDQPCEITGIRDYSHLQEQGGIQWPLPLSTPPHSTHRRLFEDGKYYTENQKAKFVFAPPTPLPYTTDSDFPLILLTGRGSSAQWHTETRTRQSKILCKMHIDHLQVEVHPTQAQELNLSDGEMVNLTSPNSTIPAKVKISPNVQLNQLYLPMHNSTVNELTTSVFDPYSRQPSYKYSPVKITKITK